MIDLRKSSEALIYGNYDIIKEEDEAIYAYLRRGEKETYLIVVNMFETHERFSLLDFTLEELVLSNYKITNELNSQLKLRPYEARVYKISEK